MEEAKSTFEDAFVYLFYLMLSADKIADPAELILGTKIMEIEKLDKSTVMKKIDFLSSLPQEKVFTEGRSYLIALNKNEQLKCLGYIKLMSKADGNLDVNEMDLLNNLRLSELNISLDDISAEENKMKELIYKNSKQEA